MTRRRIVPLALVVTALLAVVAVAARGRPLGTSGPTRSGLPGSFWDYVFTTLVIVEVFMLVVGFAAMTQIRRGPGRHVSYQRRTIRTLAFMLVAVALLSFLGRHGVLQRLLHFHRHKVTPPAHTRRSTGPSAKHPRQAASATHFRWDELAVVLGLLVVLGALAVATRTPLDPTQRRRDAPEVLAAALDESIDDLRADADLRRAIVAAYARMEVALATAGLRRRPAEAPLEYLERALLTLDTSAAAVRRLTDLFEWARFSQHEPEPSMRDEAVDALLEVRDELRASETVMP